jgi:hypothetical protein
MRCGPVRACALTAEIYPLLHPNSPEIVSHNEGRFVVNFLIPTQPNPL